MQRLSVVLASVILASSPMVVFAERVVFDFIPNALSANDMSPDGRFIVGDSDIDGNGFADGTYLLDRSTQVMTALPPLGFDTCQPFRTMAPRLWETSLIPVHWVPTLRRGGRPLEVGKAWGIFRTPALVPVAAIPMRFSGDGSTVVGLSWDGCSGRGFVWTEATGMLELQNLANGNNRASVISADGTIIGGFAQGSFDRTPAVWSNDTSGVLLDPPNGDAQGEIHGIRDDGSVLLGEFTDSIVAPLRHEMDGGPWWLAAGTDR